MKLAGKTALVTGAGRNIGRAIALELAGEGANVVVNSRQNLEGIQQVAKEAQALGVKSLPLLADVRRYEDVVAMVKQAEDKVGKIDILVNNATFRHVRPFLEITQNEWDETLGTVLNGAFNCTKAVVAGMLERRWGRIINLGGISAQLGVAEAGSISAAKGAIMGLTRSLAREFAPHGITVNVVSPGFIDVVRDPGTHDRMTGQRQVPVGHQGRPHDIAAMVVFLATDDASYITGQTISVSGGAYM